MQIHKRKQLAGKDTSRALRTTYNGTRKTRKTSSQEDKKWGEI